MRRPSGESVQRVGDRIDSVLDTDGIADLVAVYFAPGRDFAGETFTTVGQNPPNEVIVADLLAVSLLDTPFHPLAVRKLLAADFGTLFAAIPADMDIWDTDADAHLEEGSPADRLWHRLVEIPGVGPTRAGKLLARKRPRLIPIVDSVVERTLAAESMLYWLTIAACLRHPGRLESLRAIRREISAEVSDLRLLDVAIWMRRSLSARNVRIDYGMTD